jgi:hypothetical protein
MSRAAVSGKLSASQTFTTPYFEHMHHKRGSHLDHVSIAFVVLVSSLGTPGAWTTPLYSATATTNRL